MYMTTEEFKFGFYLSKSLGDIFMFKWIVILLVPVMVLGLDIEKLIDKNATETASYKVFVKKHGVAQYHECKNGILFSISHNPYANAPKEKMMRNIMLNPVKCESK